MIPLSDLAKWDQDALTTLQKVYSDPKAHQSDWLKAASAAIAYERGKPASVVVQVDFRERVKAARLRQLELDRAEWAKLEPGKTLLGQSPDEAPEPVA